MGERKQGSMEYRPRLDIEGEADYSGPSSDDHDSLARDRILVRSLEARDLPRVSAIDRRITTDDRGAYLERKLDEALHESAIRVSLVAELDEHPVGFLTARVDYGEFGQSEPVATIDTIGVDPDYAGRGVGRALLSQLLVNLSALHVERVETNVRRDDFRLLGFFYECGFAPSQKLAFSKQL